MLLPTKIKKMSTANNNQRCSRRRRWAKKKLPMPTKPPTPVEQYNKRHWKDHEMCQRKLRKKSEMMTIFFSYRGRWCSHGPTVRWVMSDNAECERIAHGSKWQSRDYYPIVTWQVGLEGSILTSKETDQKVMMRSRNKRPIPPIDVVATLPISNACIKPKHCSNSKKRISWT